MDDALFMRVMLKEILTKNGYEVAGEAQNGREAAEVYSSVKPDVVTMDVTMPEVDGLEGVRAILRQDPSAKIIMCSAMGQKSIVMEAIKAGALGFIVKPFRAEQVIKAVEKALARGEER